MKNFVCSVTPDTVGLQPGYRCWRRLCLAQRGARWPGGRENGAEPQSWAKALSDIISRKKMHFGRGWSFWKTKVELEMGHTELKKWENAEIFHFDLKKKEKKKRSFNFSFPHNIVHHFPAAHLPEHHQSKHALCLRQQTGISQELRDVLGSRAVLDTWSSSRLLSHTEGL